MLGELEVGDRVVICDLEAGLGTMLRLERGQADVVVIVAQPTAKSIDVAQRALRMAGARELRAIVVANRIRDDADLAAITDAVGEDQELVVVPDEVVIGDADRDGLAAIDLDADSPGVRALVELADRLGAMGDHARLPVEVSP